MKIELLFLSTFKFILNCLLNYKIVLINVIFTNQV
jgi:hypothetical protein